MTIYILQYDFQERVQIVGNLYAVKVKTVAEATDTETHVHMNYLSTVCHFTKGIY